VRHSTVAHSLFPSPNTSLKEIMTNSQGALFYASPPEPSCVFTFGLKATRHNSLSTASLPLGGCRLRDVWVSCTVCRVTRPTREEPRWLVPPQVLCRLVLFVRLRISYQLKHSNLRLEYPRRPMTGQTLVQDRRTSQEAPWCTTDDPKAVRAV
jgi:hypothetical protein